MRLKKLELVGFKSFAKKTSFLFESPITAIVGPNGSGKSNAAEAIRWVLGEKSMKSLRGKRGEDLIFHGGNVAIVSLIFDNTDKKFNLDYDEVTITREVYRDGTNRYLINGSVVRWRDLLETLGAVSLGSSDHFIINQGEADRVLTANAKERRIIIEDALGLRLYQWKIEESEKKLEQTEINIERVESLRREIAPHLKFLKKQVEKIRQADDWRRELKSLYLEYLKREEVYLTLRAAELREARMAPERELAKLDAELAKARANKQTDDEHRKRAEELAQIERQWQALLQKKDALERQLGRLEGQLELKESEFNQTRLPTSRQDFSFSEVANLTEQIESQIKQAEKLSDIYSIKAWLGRLKDLVKSFLARGESANNLADKREQDLANLRTDREKVALELERLKFEIKELETARQLLDEAIKGAMQTAREAEREHYTLRARESELRGVLGGVMAKLEALKLEEENFKREVEEARVLVDQEILKYSDYRLTSDEEDRAIQDERRKKIERLKIRLEDSGIEAGDTIKEYKESTERDEFLAKEITDLTVSALSLRQIIKDLREKIGDEFKTGLAGINHHFQDFFALMFGGGTAGLAITKPEKLVPTEEEVELQGQLEVRLPERDEAGGIEISVNLPRKKIRGLAMLSGGERALVSIALLFAMSQVNPPPFMVLDETDAALDEANARKYGEMVENLARHSQLVLITHNRETMSRAGLLYGVTMGGDGISRLLSIKLDDAVTFAK